MLPQVSHHPPISAAHAENDKWVYDIVSAPSTKFMGNSVEIYPVGTFTLLVCTGYTHYIQMAYVSLPKRHTCIAILL